MSYLDTMKVPAGALAWFASILKNWPARWAGAKPTEAMLYVPVVLGKRPGVEALHLAMGLRAEGCTVQQFQTAASCGPANNYRRSMVKTGWFTCTVEGKPYAFKLALTKKGEQKLDKAIAAAELAATVTQVTKPAKNAKAKRISAKANKAKAIETPTSEAPAVTGAIPAPVIEAPQVDVAALAAHFNG